jgi:hypothetical protein
MLEKMPEHQCAVTGRTFTTADAARASEARFREIQATCDAGQVPQLRKGDVIYMETELYLGHGRDDFRGGLAEVSEILEQKSAGKLAPFVRLVQQPDSLHNWKLLAAEQMKLRLENGTDWAHSDPDFRTEFNDW